MNIIFADILVVLAVLGGLGTGFVILGFFSDYILPKIPCVRKFIESLPEFED